MTGSFEFERSRSFGEAALKAMLDHEVPPTPQNYAVWFCYADGTVPELKKTIDILISNKQAFNPDLCTELYARFFDATGQLGILQNTGGRLRQIVDQVRRQVDSATGDVNAFGRSLDDFSTAIGDSGNDGLHGLVTSMVAETQRVAERNRSLEERLSQASSEVNEL